MDKKIGIPKSLLYYNYFRFYETFFREIGAEIILSCPDKVTMEKGAKLVPDEVCLPLKNYFGHIIDLKGKKIDFIFLPRFVKVENNSTFCPKIIGLPDMVKNIIHDLPPLIELDIDSSKLLLLYGNIHKIGGIFGSTSINTYKAWRKAFRNYNIHRKSLSEDLKILKKSDKLNIAVIGHPYNIYDADLNLNIMNKLAAKDISIFTPDMVSPETIIKEAGDLPKKVFWTLSRDVVGATKYFIKEPGIHGIINITSFGCGPDSIIGELIGSLIREYNKKPYLFLVLDEHTGSAGLETRLEAFIEMIKTIRERNS
ncbi:MAG: acyl-CoA dehydratase activase-related protein [bacterium]